MPSNNPHEPMLPASDRVRLLLVTIFMIAFAVGFSLTFGFHFLLPE